ncbi:MAG: TCR/Tet family MFS transporter, partial [Flavobacteriales bacterium]
MSSHRKPGMPFILISVLIDAVSIGIIIPVFPQLIMSMTGCSTSEAAVTNSLMMFWFALMQFFMSPVLGSLSDRFGRRPILLISIFGFFIDFLLLGFAPSIGWLFAGRVLAGIMGASYTTAMAYTADVTTEENRPKYFGMLGATFGMGFILGPGIGALLAHFGDVRLPFYFCAGLSLINFIYGFFILPESLDKKNRRPFNWMKSNPFSAFRNLTQYKSLAGLFIAYFLLYLAAQSVMSTWQYYTILRYSWTETDIALSLITVGVLVALVQGLLVRWLQPKLGIYKTVMIGMILYTIGFAGYGLAPTGFWLMIAAIPHCLG